MGIRKMWHKFQKDEIETNWTWLFNGAIAIIRRIIGLIIRLILFLIGLPNKVGACTPD